MKKNRVYFKIELLNSKIRNLESNGYKEYLSTWEKETVYQDRNMNHIIMTCTKGNHNGSVAEIYYNEKTGISWIEYSKQ